MFAKKSVCRPGLPGKKLFTVFSLCLFFLSSQQARAQTTLAAGDLAFIGYYRISATNAGFTFITLRSIAANTVIYFTDRGVDGSAWIANTEGYLKWTVPANLNAGAIVHVISQPSLSAVMRNGGSDVMITGSFGASTGNTFLLSSGGDQVLAYQASNPASAYPQPMNEVTFIAGVHTDYNATKYNSATRWSQRQTPTTALAGANESSVPPGLTNGVNCISMMPVFSQEYPYAKYKGSLTGTAAYIRTLINTANVTDVTTGPWQLLAGASAPSPIGMNPGDFSVSIALPVSYGTVSATIRNHQLQVKWSTVTEQDNEHFVIELSGDGTTFVPVARVLSKATAGNSSALLQYQHTIDYKPGAAALAFSFAALLVAAGFKGRSRLLLFMVLPVFVVAGMISCTKDNRLQAEGQDRLFVRISQVDKDGKSGSRSKVVQVVSE